MPGWLLPVIFADLAITGAVVWFVFRKKGAGSRNRQIVGADFKALTAFTTATHPRIGEYVRANWSGVPSQLPAVLRALLDELEKEARHRGLHVDRPMLKLLLARSLAGHGIGNGTDVRHALDEVA